MKTKSMVRWLAGAAGLGLLLYAWGHSSPAPPLGVANGRLLECPDTPNCVCSQDLDPEHAVRPLAMKKEAAATMADLRALLSGMPGAAITGQSSNYLRAEFSSRVFRFVDDLETWVDPANRTVQIRSASRVGRSDLGANRRRVEQIRRLWENLP